MTVTAVHEQDEDPMNLLTSTTRSGRSYEPNTSTPRTVQGQLYHGQALAARHRLAPSFYSMVSDSKFSGAAGAAQM